VDELDLSKHGPEDYEGKMVNCNGGEYIIGLHLGTGAEKIVHRLVNRASMLEFLVIKILRGPRPMGLVPQALAQMRREPKLASVITITHEVKIPGGMAELQPYVGGSSEAKDRCEDDLEAGGQALDRKDYATAITHYERALGRNPMHTFAMINLAAACREQKDIARAATLARQAVAVEPNLFLYRQALVAYAAETGFARDALTSFEQARRIFPYVYDLHATAIRIHLFCGEPEAARALLGDATVGAEERAALTQQIGTEIAARSAALKWAEEGKSYVQQKAYPAALEALKKAHEAYSKDCFINVNLGLALARAGDHEHSVRLLLASAPTIAQQYQVVCYANAAFSMIAAGNAKRAVALLNHVGQMLRLMNQGAIPTHPADLPGIAIWIGPDQWAEELLATATKLIDHALTNLSPDDRTDGILCLQSAYHQAAAAPLSSDPRADAGTTPGQAEPSAKTTWLGRLSAWADHRARRKT
jgi:tetratricopeptide (TPR) repeat protein